MATPERLAVVRTTLPKDAAAAFARRLVEERLAACVHTHEVRSTFRWGKGIQEEAEAFLEARTTPERAEALRKRILALHPYEVPFLEVTASDGVPPTYMDWASA
ncbi:MAG: divalent-cation tolerance protein CutA [Thermoplasmatota archaeon]